MIERTEKLKTLNSIIDRQIYSYCLIVGREINEIVKNYWQKENGADHGGLYSSCLITGRENLNLKKRLAEETTRIEYWCINIAEKGDNERFIITTLAHQIYQNPSLCSEFDWPLLLFKKTFHQKPSWRIIIPAPKSHVSVTLALKRATDF